MRLKVLSYSKKQLKFVFKLAQDVFSSTNSNTLEITGLRASVNIEKAGGAQFSNLQCQIFGVSQEDMNDITTLMWTGNKLSANSVEIYAIDDSNSYTALVFYGNIIQAWGFYQQMPDVFLYVEGINTFQALQKFYPPTSYKGSVDAAMAIERIALNLGYDFENNNVTAKINNLYAADTGIKQIQSIAIAANIDVYFDDGTIAICNPGQPRQNFSAIISQETGMVGYPTFDGIGVNIVTLFNPAITWGSKIIVQSSLERANGEWTLTSLSHDLQSQMPNGAFFTTLRGTLKNVAVTQ